MNDAFLQGWIWFFVILLGNYGMAFIGWKIYPNHHARMKLFIIVITILGIVFGCLLLFMMFQYSLLGSLT